MYIDDLDTPIITTALNLDKTIKLDDGRAWVGITAATGDSNWQTHDIKQWQFRSSYIDQIYNPPLIVNGQGDRQCMNSSVCNNFPDYDHYMRTNNLWGPGYDSTESWQTGQEGFCSTC